MHDLAPTAASPPEPNPGEGQLPRGATERRFRQRTEATRERDVFRHLLPWEETYSPKSLRRRAFPKDGTGHAALLEACPDTALAAFAQLVALRLQARRCLVSLISTQTEFVLADLAKTTALQHNAAADDPQDRLWIGTSSFPRQEGIHDEAVNSWRKARRMRDVPEEEGHYYTEGLSPHWNLVNDARHHAGHSGLAFLRSASWIRSCVSVPLRGAQGSVLGAITVLDDKPRYGISAKEMDFLEDISDTAVEHLNATIVRSQRQRGERLIQALGLFNSGRTSLRDWWLGQDDARVLGMGRHAAKGGSQERQARVDAEFGMHPEVLEPSGPDKSGAQGESQDHEDYFGAQNVQRPDRIASELPAEGTISAYGTESDNSLSHLRQSKLERPADVSDPATSSTAAYARASNLLREAIGVDSVVFADASTVTGTSQHHERGTSESSDTVSNSVVNEDSSQIRLSDVETSDSAPEASKLCNLLAFSTRGRTGTSGLPSASQRFALPEHHLQRLIKRYPHGVVFHYDGEGRCSASSDEASDPSSNEEYHVERTRRSRDGKLLSKSMNGARTAAMLPLWDDSIGRWRSCIIVWSTSSDRYFDQEEELTYLKAFGHSLGAELSRLDSLATDKAKSTFLSSISHETRSPLHGIMAGVEFLQETDLSLFQEEMVLTISMAGRTLLDTMNHILDYSKISNHSRGQRTSRRSGKGSTGLLHTSTSRPNLDETGAASSVDLARLTEEVVETTVIAYRSQYQTPLSPGNRQSFIGRNSLHQEPPSSDGITANGDDFSVLLNIDYRKSWVVKISPGAWTRILTNLLGNALKYTYGGHISVRLTVGDSDSRGTLQTALVQLVVEDTGIGISEAFQRHGLFTPFKQEDTHSTGTGLGLSIVKQLAMDVGATLDLSSKQGRGTKVTLVFPATFAVERDAKDSAFTTDSVPEDLVVDQFHLLTPTTEGADGDCAPEQLVGDSILETADEWLHCNAIQGPNIPTIDGNSVCAITEGQLIALEKKSPTFLQSLLDRASKRHSHLLILGRSIYSSTFTPRMQLSAITPVFVHQPIGPRKLLRAIASDRSSSSQAERTRPSISSPPSQTAKVAVGRSTLTVQENVENSRFQQNLPLPSVDGSDADESSPSVQSGSTKITPLPMSDAADSTPLSAIANSTASRSDTGDAESDWILLVEDNDVNMKLLIALSKKLKLKYQCAINGQEALDLYRISPDRYFLVLMDMSMPILDGFAATSKIREHEKKRKLDRTAIVALTGATTEESRKRAFDCGVDEYYAKPVRMTELKKLVNRIQEQ
ncbi:hypothetical protein M409DRAFT_28115 [Zasmidium cellare ATCC 36951]|uniref:Histidine kinase n=1 Tax=Zasmidium cellare ATCC 36951 TaxID=1080233 RepID=A0A6A6C2V8_ZASCE|nr:uncharacterized protein M409DRAFT_28115 [Zasmidium cellare ATCC 36951]KAF2161381.1 hypothetical protein M409DRAFT_28115 [Zasmidium cellare ATCC 36951]